MTSALGLLRWTPDTFWRATVYEYSAAMKGYLASKGVKTDAGMSREEFLSLRAQDEKGKKAR